jgi:LacI family transcriptional regulator
LCSTAYRFRRHLHPTSPTISSVATANDRIGFEAMKVLHRIMDGDERPKRPKLLGPEGIVERESTGIPQGGGADIHIARDFIHAHAVEGITVEDVVRSLSISRRTLEKQFSERVGHSPKREIQLVRLEKAKQLLAETELSMTQVSAMTGFSELPRFSIFFRTQGGMSPSEYREASRQR